MIYYKVVFKYGYTITIKSSEPVNLMKITNDKPFFIGNVYINNASDVLMIEEQKPTDIKPVVEDCEHCRYEGTPYCLDCINHELFVSKY